MPSNFTQQNFQLSAAAGGYLNGGNGDAVVGGVITAAPSGLLVNQGMQDIPGNRMVVGEEDALALSNLDVGQLYGGLYQYVRTKETATASFLVNRAVFWDTGVANDQFQVTSDEDGDQGIAPFAGVLINALTKGYSWWIQQAGRVNVLFTTTLTGVAADGQAVFLAGAGAGADNGTFDVLDGGGNPTFTDVGGMLNTYCGWAQGEPVGAAISTINIPLNRNYRW